jgi:hypothetical protein
MRLFAQTRSLSFRWRRNQRCPKAPAHPHLRQESSGGAAALQTQAAEEVRISVTLLLETSSPTHSLTWNADRLSGFERFVATRKLLSVGDKSPCHKLALFLRPIYAGWTRKFIRGCDLNDRLAIFEPSFGRALLVSPLLPQFVTGFWL